MKSDTMHPTSGSTVILTLLGPLQEYFKQKFRKDHPLPGVATI